jgi:hypothetical protein
MTNKEAVVEAADAWERDPSPARSRVLREAVVAYRLARSRPELRRPMKERLRELARVACVADEEFSRMGFMEFAARLAYRRSMALHQPAHRMPDHEEVAK